MAQKEIVLQQVRMGKQRDLPLAFEKGQIGFSTDVCRVFIGLPSTSEPASLVAGRNWTNSPNSGQENVEIVTEFTPWEIINKLVNKPYSVTIPANTTITTYVRGTSRLFLDYVGYNTTGPQILESGTVQMVSLNDNVILSQQNNTTADNGIVLIDFHDPLYDTGTKRMSVNIENRSANEFVMEFILRGWDIIL